MANQNRKLTFKIILSYIVLAGLGILMSFFLFYEFKNFVFLNQGRPDEKKIIETGSLISSLYEADSFSRLALFSTNEEDFNTYKRKSDSLFSNIQRLKEFVTNPYQKKLLDSVQGLLSQKEENIEQLRLLKITRGSDNSLDDILKEISQLEATMGKSSVGTLIKDPSKLSRNEKRIWQNYADWLNANTLKENPQLNSQTVDSMLVASRYIISEAKKENSRIRKSLQQKEDDLIRNDLDISTQLRRIIAIFNEEVSRNNQLESAQRESVISRLQRVFLIAGIVGGLLILIFIYFTITDFFKAEKYKQGLQEAKHYSDALLKGREQLMAAVSHDLKTPLNTVIGYSDLFQNTTLSQKQNYYLNQITSNSQFIANLVDDLLDFSKLEAGKIALEAKLFNLESLIKETSEGIKSLYATKPVILLLDIDPSILGKVFKSDPLRLRQILTNLIGNAFKFTEEGTVTVSAKILREEGKNLTVQCKVLDTGIGISTAQQTEIFKEFTQADASIFKKFGGSGLGLAISKKLSALLGGSLEVSSVLGKGSEFTLTLPLLATTVPVPSETSKTFSLHKKLTIVVVDDDPGMRTMLFELFTHLQFDCTPFSGLQDLLDSTIHHFDCLFTDIQMPEASGYMVLKALHQGRVSAYNHQPIIAMTGSREYKSDHYVSFGFAEMLAKPFQKNDVLALLATLFPQHIKKPGFSKTIIKNTPSDGKPYNLSMLSTFLANREALMEIVTLFMTQSKKDIQELSQAAHKKDDNKVNAISHRMLSMCRQIQANKLIPLLEQLENCKGVHFKNEQVKTWLKELEIEMQQLLTALQDEVV